LAQLTPAVHHFFNTKQDKGVQRMAQVLCEVSEGLRPSEATVKLTTYNGRPEFLPVDRGLLADEGERHYLSVGLVFVNREQQAALVSLPVEADSGAHRLWVKLDHLKPDQGVSA
jgi:hypothetical protein